MIEKIGASDSVADTVVDSDSDGGGTVSEPRKLKNKRWGSFKNIGDGKRKELSPLGHCFRGFIKEISDDISIGGSFDEKGTLSFTYYFET